MKAGLGPVVNQNGKKKRKAKPAKPIIEQKRPAHFAISGGEQTEQQRETQNPQVEIGFKIPVVRLVCIPFEYFPNLFASFSQPETFESGPQDRIHVSPLP